MISHGILHELLLCTPYKASLNQYSSGMNPYSILCEQMKIHSQIHRRRAQKPRLEPMPCDSLSPSSSNLQSSQIFCVICFIFLCYDDDDVRWHYNIYENDEREVDSFGD
ncbi:uncharacterized protein EURHEDRAFT_301396 [Aspergillus ruber CBS 135680]|uniref:Uncharacterized protein n=1 Tax=Aspergillus ruber (strain CBS 135680) TaxID=1388766 RepID=A0A017SLK0_ASPRC|nr:uncharacterized protein EURHEDRAFT_301396 [Aspergillus ruber CBS 135680]EYE97636.1 hypothetical protein EURHEDRAFT_301396 [Aspergillus ruber CBS 135680]